MYPGNLSAARPTEAVPGLLLDAIVRRGRSVSVQGCGGVAFDRNRGPFGLGSPRTGILDDELYDRLRVFRRKRKMPFARPDDNRDLSVEFLITFLDDASLTVQPGIQGAAIVQDRHACFRERRKVINRLLFARHETVHA